MHYPQFLPSVTCSCSPCVKLIRFGKMTGISTEVVLTSPTKSTISSFPLYWVVASLPLAALHSSALPNSKKAYLVSLSQESLCFNIILSTFNYSKGERHLYLISLVDLTAFLGVLTNLISECRALISSAVNTNV